MRVEAYSFKGKVICAQKDIHGDISQLSINVCNILWALYNMIVSTCEYLYAIVISCQLVL